MAYDVFVSYSSKDKAIADAVCATLESNRIRCWIAPRDVPPGMSYPAALSKAIDDCRTMVLVFSSDSNTSPQVIREVERAVSKGKPIVPFRIHNVQPSPDMGYLIGTLHWLDALTPPLEAHLRQLVVTVQSFLSAQSADSAQPIQVPRVAQPAPWHRKTRRALTAILTGLGVVAILAIVLRLAGLYVYYYPNRGNAWEIRWGPPPTPVAQGMSPTPVTQGGSPSASGVAPTLISMVNTPIGVPSSPVLATGTAIPTARPSPLRPVGTATSAVPATPKPTPTAIPGDKILFEEHFDNPEYDGDLPPSLDRYCATGSSAQKDGRLVLDPIEESNCSLQPKVRLTPDQFGFLRMRFMYAGKGSLSVPLASFGFSMNLQSTQEFLDAGAILAPPRFNLNLGDHTQPRPEYSSPPVSVSPDTWYTLELDLVNPETFELFLHLNGARIGSYKLAADRAARWRTGEMMIVIVHSAPLESGLTVYVDDLLIVGR